MTRLRADHPFNTASPEIAARAKEIAAERGHRDVEAEIVCHDGERTGIRVPVWQFFIAEAQLELPWSSEAEILVHHLIADELKLSRDVKP